MRCNTAVLARAWTKESAELANDLLSRVVHGDGCESAQAASRSGSIHSTRPCNTDDQRLRLSGLVWWAWEDLNLRPHPYQVSRAKRCADRRFPRSRATVRGEGMRS